MIHFIVGLGRSGTTVYGQLLAANYKGIYIGESIYLRGAPLHKEAYCGCGEELGMCSFWNNVPLDNYYLDKDYNELFKLKHLVFSYRSQKKAAEKLYSLWSMLGSEHGVDIVDSSKLFPLAWHLRKYDKVKFYLIIRNLWQVVMSMRSTTIHPITGNVIRLHNGGLYKTPFRWVVVNALYKVLPISKKIIINSSDDMKRIVQDKIRKNPKDHSVSSNPSKFLKRFVSTEKNVEAPLMIKWLNKIHIR